MLRKSSAPIHKDQSKGDLMPETALDSCFSPDVLVHKNKNRPFFSLPGLFVGFSSSKGLSDYDSAMSPTSPLDFRNFSSLANSPLRSPKSSVDGPPKSWDCKRVGLRIVDSLNDEKKPCGTLLGSLQSKNIVFGSQMRINSNSCQDHLNSSVDCPTTHIKSPHIQLGGSEMGLVSSEVQFNLSDSCKSFSPQIGSLYRNANSDSDENWLDRKNSQLGTSPLGRRGLNFEDFSGVKSSSLPISVGTGHGLNESLSASEIELSEDYTCIISYGPNPRKTHIFGDRILESHTDELVDCNKPVNCLENCLSYPSDGFLSFCYSCKKKLEEGEDIYMYRGEKAFCSCECRSREILVEEEMEKATISSFHSAKSTHHEDIF